MYMKVNKQLLFSILYPVLSIVIALVIWSIVAVIVDQPLMLPSIGSVFGSLGKLLSNTSTYQHIFATLIRTIICFVISAIIASLIVVLCTVSKVARGLILPLMTIVTALPTMAIILIVIVVFSPNTSPIVVTSLVVMPVVFRAALVEMDNSKQLCDMLKVYRVKRTKVFAYMYLPTIGKVISANSYTTLPLALKVVVSAEVLAYTVNSIGLAMLSSRLDVDIATLIAWTVLCVLLCFALQGIVKLIQYICRRATQCR